MNKKHLVIYCNPNKSSLNHSISETILTNLTKKGNKVTFINLYEEAFSPVLTSKDIVAGYQGMQLKDVLKYQLLINEHDNIIFIFPIWWYQMPGILKGWVDRVFSYNFAYIYENNINIGMLKNKTSSFIITMGNVLSNKLEKHYYDTFCTGITEFCGIKTKTFFVIDKVNTKTQIEIKKDISKIESLINSDKI